MASASFVLKEPSGTKETLIYLLFRFDSMSLKYSTGLKISPKFWNVEKQRAKETRLFPDTLEFNTFLNRLENLIHSNYRRLINDDTKPTAESLRIALDESLKRKENINKKLLLPFAEDLIKNTSKSHNTIKNYEQTRTKLADFEKEFKVKLKFEDINLDFYNSFYNFCNSKGYGINTIGNLVKNIKVFMNEALERKLHQNIEYKNKRFKTVEEESENIYLTSKEIEAIYKLELEPNSRLDKVRDMFIISCFTGLRYSDLVKLNTENIIDKGTKLKIQTEKTGEIVIIPLHPYIRKIIEKYKGLPTYQISNQKMNDYIKELGKLAKLDEQILLSSTKGGIKKSESLEKHQLITIHTARRSFATNAYLMDIPTISIMKLTGHKTEKAFLKYIKISQDENANKLMNHPFFS